MSDAITVWTLVATLLATSGVASSASTDEDCEATRIMQCLTSVSNSANKEQLFFPDTQAKLKEYCKYLLKGLECANQLIENCASEAEKEIYHNLTNDMIGMNVALCTEGSPLSSRFLKHVNCYKDLSDRFGICSDRYIGNIVVVHGLTQQEQVKMTCCTVHEYHRCMRNAVEGRCEQDAQKLVEDTVFQALTTSFQYCNQVPDLVMSDCLRSFSASKGHATGSLDQPNQASSLEFAMGFAALVAFLLVSSWR